MRNVKTMICFVYPLCSISTAFHVPNAFNVLSLLTPNLCSTIHFLQIVCFCLVGFVTCFVVSQALEQFGTLQKLNQVPLLLFLVLGLSALQLVL